jgi:hypothetical protein
MNARMTHSTLGEEMLVVGFSFIPARRGRFEVECFSQGWPIGRRYKLTSEQLEELTRAYTETVNLDQLLSWIGIWRKASKRRRARTFLAHVLTGVERLKREHARRSEWECS